MTHTTVVAETIIIEYCLQHPAAGAKEVARAVDTTVGRVHYIWQKHSRARLPRPGHGPPQGHRPHVDPSRRDKRIALLIFQGWYQFRVADRVGLSRQRVQQILDKHWPSMRRWSAERKRQRARGRIIAHLMKVPRQPDKSIAAHLKCCPKTVGIIRHELGLPRLPPPNRGRYQRGPTTPRTRRACRMLLAGHRRKDVAAACGITPGAITSLRRRWIIGRLSPSRAAPGGHNRPVWRGSPVWRGPGKKRSRRR